MISIVIVINLFHLFLYLSQFMEKDFHLLRFALNFPSIAILESILWKVKTKIRPDPKLRLMDQVTEVFYGK